MTPSPIQAREGYHAGISSPTDSQPKSNSTQVTSRPETQIKSLTGLRFFAALWVVLLHFATHQHTLSGPSQIHHLFNHGQLGVALFFVLSGFVLGYTYLDKAMAGKLDKKSFYIARFARVYPVFFLCIVVFTPFAWRFVRADHDTGQSVAMMAQSFGLQVTLLQTWFTDAFYATNWNTPSWSISVEAFFYLSFPFLIPFFGKNSSRANLAWAVGLIGLLFVSRLAYAWIDPDQLRGADANVVRDRWAGLLFYNPVFRVVEFALGIILVRECLRYRERIQSWNANAMGVGFLAVLVLGLALWSFPHSTAVAIWAYPATVVCLSLIIFFVATERVAWLKVFLSSAPLVLLGEASYSMYMLQRPVAEYTNWAAQKIGWGPVEYSITTFWVFMIVLTGISIATYKVIEMPLRKRIRGWFK